MIERHYNALLARFDELLTKRTTYIAWEEIYLWYGCQRISKTPYRDIRRHWRSYLSTLGRESLDLHASTLHGGVVLFYSPDRQTLLGLCAYRQHEHEEEDEIA